MDRQWITAATALAIVSDGSDSFAGRRALCSRAHQRLIKTRAKAFTVCGEPRNDQFIAPGFWWAEGHQALKQDWRTGDFSTWLNQKFECKAFGVTFDLDGVLDLVPAERHARLRLSLSAAGDPAWVSAIEARRVVYGRGGVAPTEAGATLIDQCRLGFVVARAVLMQRAEKAPPSDWSAQEREWDIPRWFWTNFTTSDEWSHDWERGMFAGRGKTPTGESWITLSGTHFQLDGLDALFSSKGTVASDAAGSAQERSASVGGRPPAAYWDDLWCAVTAQIYSGELIPKTQADIEKAMLDWASARGHEPGTSTIRIRARKLFAALNAEGQKPRTG